MTEDAFRYIEQDNYAKALEILSRLEPDFNVRLGLVACYFDKFSDTHEMSDLDLAINNCKEANKLFSEHFDIHFTLAQCYATKYFMLLDPQFKQLAIDEYEESKKYVNRPGSDPAELEARIDALLQEIKDEIGMWN